MIKEMKKDLLNIRIYDTRVDLGGDAGKMIGNKIRELLDRQQYVNMVFGAAPSQDETLATLVAESGIDWGRVNGFHMDEYIGLGLGASQSFGKFLKDRLFDQLSFHAVHYLNGNANNLFQECERYTHLLSLHPTDIVCMGIGENTHIAFNDPHVAQFDDPELVKIVNMDDECRAQQVHDGCFNTIKEVPLQAITMTVPALFRSRFAYCMVPGNTKANAVHVTLTSDIQAKYPATILRKHPDATLFLDQESSALFTDKVEAR